MIIITDKSDISDGSNAKSVTQFTKRNVRFILLCHSHLVSGGCYNSGMKENRKEVKMTYQKLHPICQICGHYSPESQDRICPVDNSYKRMEILTLDENASLVR